MAFMLGFPVDVQPEQEGLMGTNPIVALWFDWSYEGRWLGERGVYHTYVLKCEDPNGNLSALIDRYTAARTLQQDHTWFERYAPFIVDLFSVLDLDWLESPQKRLSNKILRTFRSYLRNWNRRDFTISVSNGTEHRLVSEREEIISKINEILMLKHRQVQFWQVLGNQLDTYQHVLTDDVRQRAAT